MFSHGTLTTSTHLRFVTVDCLPVGLAEHRLECIVISHFTVLEAVALSTILVYSFLRSFEVLTSEKV